MPLFAFTRQEGSDERNPWPIVLRGRLGFQAPEAVLCAVAAYIFLRVLSRWWREPGLLVPLPVAAFGIAPVGGLLHAVIGVRRVTRSPLLLDSATTPQGMRDVAAALERHGQWWATFAMALLGIGLTAGLIGQARALLPEQALVWIGFIPLHLAGGFLVWAITWTVMGMTSNQLFRFQSLDRGAHLQATVGCALALPVIIFLMATAAFVTGLTLFDIPEIKLALLGRMPRASGGSLDLLAEPLMLTAALAGLALLLLAFARLIYQDLGALPIDDLRAAMIRRRRRGGAA